MTYDFGDVSDERRRTMEAIGSEDTGPERKAEAALEELSVGFKKQPRFGRYKPDFHLEDGTVLQVMGCFWHGCPCQRGMDEVETNEDYWTPKLRQNMSRDKRRRRELIEEHGVPFVFWVWEHQEVAERVAQLCAYRGLA